MLMRHLKRGERDGEIVLRWGGKSKDKNAPFLLISAWLLLHEATGGGSSWWVPHNSLTPRSPLPPSRRHRDTRVRVCSTQTFMMRFQCSTSHSIHRYMCGSIVTWTNSYFDQKKNTPYHTSESKLHTQELLGFLPFLCSFVLHNQINK